MLADNSPAACSTISPSLLQFAQEWVERDPNETTAAHVQRLIHERNQPALQALFPTTHNENVVADIANAQEDCLSFQRIGFGTAGLRASMTPGPMGMNDLVVVQSAQGLVRHCEKAHHQQGSDDDEIDATAKLCAVIGYDHRSNPALQLSSLSFALLTALVFMEAGWEILLLDNFCATPLVPFALLHHQKMYHEHLTEILPVVGIMITASHNPKQDAGYKVYWKDGCQIRSPTDQQIADSILQNLQPWTDYRKLLLERRKQYPSDACLGLSRPAETQELIASYYTALQQSGLVTGQGRLVSPTTLDWISKDDIDNNSCDTAPRFCYTAMHGIGYRFVKQCFQTFGLPPFVSVPTQQEPNPDFPTVVFPNPEEEGALDLAQEYASQNDCDIILANDPDADRLAVAEKSRSTGKWTVFTGDQIGAMLGLWLWQTFSQQEREKTPKPRPIAMCASTVSSKLLAEIAKVEGFHFEDTLTGFKWIGSRASHLHHNEGYRTIFCYEEAIGFCCGDVVFDKDGVSAMAVFAELSIAVYRQGKSLVEHLQSIYNKYGHFVSNNGYFVLTEASAVPRIMSDMTLGENPGQLKSVGPYAVESVRYLGEPGYDSTTPDKKPTLPTSKSSPMMTIRFGNGCVAQFRASGTEPKFKYYIELKGKPGVALDTVRKELMEMSNVILEELLHPRKYGLIKQGSSNKL